MCAGQKVAACLLSRDIFVCSINLCVPNPKAFTHVNEDIDTA